ncbi:MAG: DUF134 domain-containing protein [Lachnospiraceae bacterium]|nr:DUF134 domain-containing protein [Lachnospiraceae bacterium]
MARPQRSRKICSEPKYKAFAPLSYTSDEVSDEDVVLSVDEYETIRLIDLIGLTQEQCAKHMGVSRTTVTEIYDRARHKVAHMLIEGRELIIDGGNYSVCNGHHPDGAGLCDKCMSLMSGSIK